MSLDPSQRAAEPLPSLNAAEVLRKIEADKSKNPDDQANRILAAMELAMIEELLGLAAFRWFEAEFIDKPYRIAFDNLRSQGGEAFQSYKALKEVKGGMIQREITQRETVSPDDPRITYLREKLRSL